jgi:hypothetical protein
MSDRTASRSSTRSSGSRSIGFRGSWTRPVVAYWFFTLVIVYENLSGFVWWAVNFDLARSVIRHLGYPEYFINILGPAQLVAAVILIAPGLPIAKEWAYAGAFINYSSAVASHLLAGDGLNVFVFAAAGYAVFTVTSWALRPASRRVAGMPWIGETRASSWISALGVVVTMAIASLLTLPLIASLAALLPPLTS